MDRVEVHEFKNMRLFVCRSVVLNRLANVFLSFSLSSCVLSCFFVLKSHFFCAKFVPAVRPNQSSLNSHGTPWSCTSNDSQLKIVIARSHSNSWGHSIWLIVSVRSDVLPFFCVNCSVTLDQLHHHTTSCLQLHEQRGDVQQQKKGALRLD